MNILDKKMQALHMQNEGLEIRKKGLEMEQEVNKRMLQLFINHHWDGENWNGYVPDDVKDMVNEAIEMIKE